MTGLHNKHIISLIAAVEEAHLKIQPKEDRKMKEVPGQFLTLTLVVLAGFSSTQALDLDAEMCINGQHAEKCCYETYCPSEGDGSHLPTNTTGKV